MSRLKVVPGLGEAGSDGKRVTPGLGDDGKPTSGVTDVSETADQGSGSVGACDGLREWVLISSWASSLSSMLIVLSGELSGGVMGVIGTFFFLGAYGSCPTGTGGGAAGA